MRSRRSRRERERKRENNAGFCEFRVARIPPNQGHEPPFTPLRGKILHLHPSPSLPWSHRVKREYLADGTMDEPCKEGPTRDLFKSPSDFLLFHGPQNVALSTFPIILPFPLSLLLPFIVHHCGERSRGIGRNRFVSRLARVCR